MRHGLLEQMAQKDSWSTKYVGQMIDSAKALGEKYQVDPKHAEEVAGLCLQLFDALESEHNLQPRDRVLLHIAALVHEVGGFVSANAHHKHSLYLLLHNDIFGLGSRNKQVVANVARYHRQSGPKPSHSSYVSLSRDERIRVLQLSAILRVADSLARSRGKRIRTIYCEQKEGEWIIRVPNVDNLHLESAALQRRGGLFEDVFGMNVNLVKG
jgi:exopolyphosphatase/guanosine-5'-triphosphate,3'-diphosphate pyrophosphatase